MACGADAVAWGLFPNELNGMAGGEDGFTRASWGVHGMLGCELQYWRLDLIAFLALEMATCLSENNSNPGGGNISLENGVTFGCS